MQKLGKEDMEENQKKLEELYIIQDGKKLYYGYTTGSCAAAAAKAAVYSLLSGEEVAQVELLTPKGIPLFLEVEEFRRGEEKATCAIRKYAGDDPDVTDKILVYATVEKTQEPGVWIDGGVGVGRVTKKGLDQPVGNAAINRVPRKMILEAVQEVMQQFQYKEGIQVLIEAPKGVELAKKTFNPRLGIEGGISILGTSGIVVPMSEEALLRSIEVEMRMRMEDGDGYLLVTPGNYGEAYLKEHMKVDFSKNIKCSNYVGKTIDMAINMGAKGILFVSHIGKFVKVSGGIMDTHSKNSDCRAELLAAHAITAGADAETARKILHTITTDEALALMEKAGVLENAMERMMEQIDYYLKHRASEALEIGAVVFSNVYGYLGKTKDVDDLIKQL